MWSDFSTGLDLGFSEFWVTILVDRPRLVRFQDDRGRVDTVLNIRTYWLKSQSLLEAI